MYTISTSNVLYIDIFFYKIHFLNYLYMYENMFKIVKLCNFFLKLINIHALITIHI